MMKKDTSINRIPLRLIIIPGVLTAMTGVGVGDLATASFAGNKLGVAIVWAVLLGAFFKYVVSTGFVKWQLATGESIIDSCIKRYKIIFQVLFGAYFFLWSYFVGGALISACGTTMANLLPIFSDPNTGKIVFGIVHTLVAILLIKLGGYKIFSKIMGFMAVLLFGSVLISVIALQPDFIEILKGLVIPVIPSGNGEGVSWTIALIGGVGGTLTIISYGYWINQEDRKGTSWLSSCRLDLGIGYLLTAVFGISMVVIGAMTRADGTKLNLLLNIANNLEEKLGTAFKYIFLIGSWGAVFSSMLGVWQSVPQIFVDGFVRNRSKETEKKAYNIYLVLLGVVPILALLVKFVTIQKIYSFYGAFFVPFLAVILLVLNNSKTMKDKGMNNKLIENILLALILGFFLYITLFA